MPDVEAPDGSTNEEDWFNQALEAKGVPAPVVLDEDEPEEDEEEEPEEETEEEKLYAGKFKSAEEMERAYLETQTLMGRQTNEVGELRKAVEQLAARPQQQQTPGVDTATIEALDMLTAQDPQQAALWAIQNQPLLYNRVVQQWAAEDPVAAMRFENSLMLTNLREEMLTQVAPVTESQAHQVAEQQFQASWLSVAERLPEINQFADAMMASAESMPEVAQALIDAPPADKERLIENLYYLAKGRQAGSVPQAKAAATAKKAAEAVAEKVAATVVAGTNGQTAPPPDDLAEWKRAFIAPSATSIHGQ